MVSVPRKYVPSSVMLTRSSVTETDSPDDAWGKSTGIPSSFRLNVVNNIKKITRKNITSIMDIMSMRGLLRRGLRVKSAIGPRPLPQPQVNQAVPRHDDSYRALGGRSYLKSSCTPPSKESQ